MLPFSLPEVVPLTQSVASGEAALSAQKVTACGTFFAPFKAESKEQFWAFALVHKHPALLSGDFYRMLPVNTQAALSFIKEHSFQQQDGSFCFEPLISARKQALRSLFSLKRDFAHQQQE